MTDLSVVGHPTRLRVRLPRFTGTNDDECVVRTLSAFLIGKSHFILKGGRTLKFHDTMVLKAERISIGIEEVSGRYYVSFPVCNGVVDYEEYYEIDRQTYAAFLADVCAAASFADECRRHERDELLILNPGTNRGTPV